MKTRSDVLMMIGFNRLKSKLMNQGLGFRLKIFFTLVSLVPLVVLGIFSYSKSAGMLQANTSRYTSAIMDEMNFNMFLRFSKIDDAAKIIMNSSTMKEILMKDDANRDFYEDNIRVTQLLKSIAFSNDYITSIFVLPEKNNSIFAVGNVTGLTGYNYLTDDFRRNYRKSQLYTDTVDAMDNYKWWPVQEVLGQKVFVLSRKIQDVEKGVLGVVVIHVSSRIMDDIRDRMTREQETEIYIADDTGRVFYGLEGRGPEDEAGINKIVNKAMQSETGNFTANNGRKKVFVVYNTFFPVGWKVITQTPYLKMIADANVIGKFTLIVALICVLLTLLISAFITKGVLNPLYKLMKLMKKGAGGELSVRFNTQYQDEVGQLGDSFNQMMEDIQKLMQLVEKENKMKVEAQIHALEAHINPHFLYNTLASMYWSAMAKGNIEVAQMASSLSKFFRLGLNKGREFTTVENEIEHVKEYLSIQKLLYNNRFNFKIKSDKEVLPFKTIKLILQPLVENSLVHGLEKCKKQGWIKIEVELRENRVLYRVTDNGTGIPRLNERGLQQIIDEGYGLKNIQERLRLYFENNFTMSCTSNPGEETVFEVTIPATVQEEAISHV